MSLSAVHTMLCKIFAMEESAVKLLFWAERNNNYYHKVMSLLQDNEMWF